MKLIPLSRGFFAQVDDEDYDYLMQWKWYAHTHTKHSENLTYAIRNIPAIESYTGKRTAIKMHRQIMNVSDKDIHVDHIDHNGLNCQKDNMRLCSNSQNTLNRKGVGSSKYLGVSLWKGSIKYKDGSVKHYTKWRAIIRVNGKNKSLGLYDSEECAARAYDKIAADVHKEFANLNFKD